MTIEYTGKVKTMLCCLENLLTIHYQSWYHPENMVCSVCGKITKTESKGE